MSVVKRPSSIYTRTSLRLDDVGTPTRNIPFAIKISNLINQPMEQRETVKTDTTHTKGEKEEEE